MIEFAFVWTGIGALVLLFLIAALGGCAKDGPDKYGGLFFIVLIFMVIWPLILIPMYQDRKNFKF